MPIPAFLLRKLYVKGSLQNVDDGFEFRLKNRLSNSTAVAMSPVRVDDKEYPLDSTTVRYDDEVYNAGEISESSPFPIRLNEEITVHIAGEQLSPGEHKIYIELKTREVGQVGFDVEDSI